MKLFLLLAIISTTDDYKRGFGDGIAASKSASAAIHMERFENASECEVAKDAFLGLAPVGSKAECTYLIKKPINKGSK